MRSGFTPFYMNDRRGLAYRAHTTVQGVFQLEPYFPLLRTKGREGNFRGWDRTASLSWVSQALACSQHMSRSSLPRHVPRLHKASKAEA